MDLAAWGDFDMLLQLHELFDLFDVLGRTDGALAAADESLLTNFGVAGGLSALLAVEPDAFLPNAAWAQTCLLYTSPSPRDRG